MKNTLVSIGFEVLKFVSLLSLATTLFCGCGQKNAASSAKIPGDAQATMEFWETVQSPNQPNTLFQRIAGFSSERASSPDIRAAAVVFKQVGDGCRAKASQITKLPLVKVDPEAVQYAVKKAKLLNASAQFCQSVAAIIDKQQALTDGETLLTDYIFALARHADDGQEAWGNALKEEFVGKAKTFGNFQLEGQGVAEFLQNLQAEAADLQTTEMQTRAALSQRYGLEFPTTDAAKKASPSVKPAVISSEKLVASREALMQNLIDRDIITRSGGLWTFDQMREFQTFDVVGGTNYGDVVDYEVATHVKGWLSGWEREFRLLMTYQKQNESLKLMFVRCL